jgi:hypothetical protein
LVSLARVAWGDVDPRLDYAANSLTFAAGQVVTELQKIHCLTDTLLDAQTLQDGAEHFQEEVELGPVDLPTDFATINEVYNEVRSELTASNELKQNADVRNAWFDTEEAFINLRLAWAHYLNPGQGNGQGGGDDGHDHGGDNGHDHGGDNGHDHGGDNGHDHGGGNGHDHGGDNGHG